MLHQRGGFSQIIRRAAGRAVRLALTVGSSGRQLFAGISQSGATSRRRDGEEWLEAFSESPWLSATTSLVARGVAGLNWKIVRTMDSGGRTFKRPDIQKGTAQYRRKELAGLMRVEQAEDVHDHPLLGLLRSPCPAFTGRTSIWLSQVYEELMGECFFLVDRYAWDSWIQRGTSGRPIPRSLWPIPPNWVKRTPDSERPTFDIQHLGVNMVDVPMTEVLWKKRPDVRNPYARGAGVMRSLVDELNADESAARLQNYAFYNRNRPDLLVTLPGFDTDQVKAYARDWTAGLQGLQSVSKAHFTNVDAKVQTFSQDFRSMQVEELRKFSRDMFRQVRGIPPEMLGILDQSNRSTAEAAEFLFARYVLEPLAEDWRDFWAEKLLPEYDDRAVLEFESPVQEDRNFQLSAAGRFPTVIKINEQRAIAGMPPLSPEEGGEHFLVTAGLQAVPSLMDLVAQAPPAEAPPPSGAGPVGLGIEVPGAEHPPFDLAIPGATSRPQTPPDAAPGSAAPSRVPPTTTSRPPVPGGSGSSLQSPTAKAVQKAPSLADVRLTPDESLAVGRWLAKCGSGAVDLRDVLKGAPVPVTGDRQVEYVRRSLAFLRGHPTIPWDGLFGSWSEGDADMLDRMLGVKGWTDAEGITKGEK